MSVLEKYNEIKKIREDVIIFIKTGIFYRTYCNDALIIKSLFNYELKNKTIGFPLKNLEFIIHNLNVIGIDVFVLEEFDKDYVVYPTSFENKYNFYLKRSKLLNEYDNNLNKLFDLIKSKTINNKDNLEKVKDYVNEL